MRRDGRPAAGLAESWKPSADGLTWLVRLRPSVMFHSGRPANADAIRLALLDRLPAALGPAADDLAAIRAVSDRDLEFVLRRRSTFVLEQLADVAIEEPNTRLSGTGPFKIVSVGREVEMRANETYHRGRSLLDRVVIEPYASVRSAWADMLRGRVDMLYEVGTDAMDSLQSSNEVSLFTFERSYAYLVLLNLQRPYLKDPAFRRELNAAVDRSALVGDGLGGHGMPADGAVWPKHWAFSNDLPRFRYLPRPGTEGPARPRLRLLFGEPSLERLALVLQRQLQVAGIELVPELVPGDQVLPRLRAGDFDAVLSDYLVGPNMVRPYWYWHTGAPYNFGRYSNGRVDAGLDAVRHAASDADYQAGVAVYERAIVDDPPAIFLAWRERAVAVSRRFVVPAEPDTDVFLTLRLWRAHEEKVTRNN